MNHHPDPITLAFDTIHTEMRRLRAENCQLRMQVNQQKAATQLVVSERDDLKEHVERLRGHCCRNNIETKEQTA